ncbi:MAG: hypothetical protein R3F56_17010 [Planctomycetota bacterium]
MTPPDTLRRILVALDVARHDRSWLGLAAEFAARLRADVRLLFVEDLDLLRAADLPFAREIDLLTTGAVAFDVATVEARLRRLSKAARESFASAATQQHVAWSLEVVRGRLPREIESQAQGGDLLVFPHRPAPRARGRVAALCAGGEGGHAALRRARDLAAPAGLDVVFVGHAAQPVRELQLDLLDEGTACRSVVLRPITPDVTGLRALRRDHPFDVAVICASEALALEPAALADALGCPILVVPA